MVLGLLQLGLLVRPHSDSGLLLLLIVGQEAGFEAAQLEAPSNEKPQEEEGDDDGYCNHPCSCPRWFCKAIACVRACPALIAIGTTVSIPTTIGV